MESRVFICPSGNRITLFWEKSYKIMGRELSLPIKKTLFICLFLMDRQRNITEKDMSKPRQKRKKEKQHHQQKPIGLETKTLPLKLKFLTFQSLCLTSGPSFSNNLLPYFIRRLLRPATAVDVISSLSIFRIWNGGYWCSRSRQSSTRFFFLRKHGKKTMPRIVFSVFGPRVSCKPREFLFLLSYH